MNQTPFLVVNQMKKKSVFTYHHMETLPLARSLVSSLLKSPGADYCIIQGPGLPPNGERIYKSK